MRVVCNGNPALRVKSLPVMSITDEIRELARRMIVTMKENELPGVGLAARKNQEKENKTCMRK